MSGESGSINAHKLVFGPNSEVLGPGVGAGGGQVGATPARSVATTRTFLAMTRGDGAATPVVWVPWCITVPSACSTGVASLSDAMGSIRA